MSEVEGERQPLTVRELIDLLSALPDDSLPVEVEGCDCSGGAKSVEVDPGRPPLTPSGAPVEPYVLITRIQAWD